MGANMCQRFLHHRASLHLQWYNSGMWRKVKATARKRTFLQATPRCASDNTYGICTAYKSVHTMVGTLNIERKSTQSASMMQDSARLMLWQVPAGPDSRSLEQRAARMSFDKAMPVPVRVRSCRYIQYIPQFCSDIGGYFRAQLAN